ncbi:uncharacterized protein PHALS_14984 [Plasmopara halstedii]|uniref:Uncharacterized protein n=1 Tax=Plasmopara halstedii TaxID=4781 RepID=A0A0P1A8Z6_PLAHL|nr:uncharacterized protein PHALS_14984 [Plasmopara halstedii]CEG36829.1 hypothetical protein PHALS_14984 [Plasmopara halstedii]|eukprot:XP_024573198.1 hypothetical protein PHALS_14984 [Plasmopara halstedii]
MSSPSACWNSVIKCRHLEGGWRIAEVAASTQRELEVDKTAPNKSRAKKKMISISLDTLELSQQGYVTIPLNLNYEGGR